MGYSLLAPLILRLNITEDIVSKLSNEVTNFIFHNDYEINEQDKQLLLLGPGIGEIKDIGYNSLLHFFVFLAKLRREKMLCPYLHQSLDPTIRMVHLAPMLQSSWDINFVTSSDSLDAVFSVILGHKFRSTNNEPISPITITISE